MKNPESITLQLHYCFSNELSHSMNAKVHNECDKQFIHAIQILNKYIDTPFEISVSAKNEGGILDYYNIIINNPLVLILLTALITSSTQQFFTSNFAPAIDVSEATKNKLDNIEKVKELIKSNELTSEEFDYIASNDKDLKKLKSNFFKSAKKEHTITQIEVVALRQDNSLVFDKKIINYIEFDNCILTEEQEKSTTVVQAKIYIVSPILIKGRNDLWKGIYNEEVIEFKVSDKIFLSYVHEHIIKFSNGTYIDCNMTVSTTISSIDEKEKISRNVSDVITWGDNENTRTVVKHKPRNKQPIETSNLQLGLFF